MSTIDEKLRSIKEWVFKNESNISVGSKEPQIQFGIPSKIKLDQKFNTFIVNVNTLDSLYRDFFNSTVVDPSRSQSVVEVKNRCFKDLYNLIEESVVKFYEIYTECQSLSLKNVKLEETFHQLEQVFSQNALDELTQNT